MRKYGKILQEACEPEHYNCFQFYTDKRRTAFGKEGAKSQVTNVQNVTTLNQDLTRSGQAERATGGRR